MYIKLIGAVLIIISCWGIGISCGKKLELRRDELIEIKRIMELVRGEIRYQLTPLPHTFTENSEKMKEPFRDLFQKIGRQLEERKGITLVQIWEAEWLDKKKELHINAKDFDFIKTLGTSLGYLDKEMQIGSIDFFLQQLETCILDAASNVQNQKKLYQTLGLMGGFLVVIVLL